MPDIIPDLNTIAQKTKDFFAPSPDNVRARDVVRELPEGMKEVGEKIGKFFIAQGQASFRGFAAVQSTVTRTPITPETPFQKELFGTDKKITPRSFGAETGLNEKNPITPVVGFVLGAADLIPGGNTTKATAVNLLKNADNADDALKILTKTIGATKEVASKYLDDAVRLTDEKQLSGLVDNVISETPKIAGKLRERGFVTSVKEAFPNASSKVAGQYIPRSTDELAMKAKNLIQDDIVQAERMATTGTDDHAVATAAELIKHYAEAASVAVDTATKAALEDKMAAIANPMARNLTEQGRAIQAASILSRLTPEGQVRFAAREIQKYNEMVDKSKLPFGTKIPELTGQQAGKIVEDMRRIQGMPDGLERAKEFQKVQEGIFDLVPSPLMKKIATVWKAGLLTGIKTSGLNIFSNTAHGISETVKDVPAAVVDTVASLFTGKRTNVATTKGVINGVQEGFDKGLQYLKTGFDERDIATKLEYQRVRFGNGKFAKTLQKYEETVFRVLGSEDQPFYYGAKARSLMSQALAQGKNAGLHGDDLTEFANNLSRNPSDDMLRYAGIDAETAVFQNRTEIHKVGSAIQNLGKGTQAEGIGEFIVPFSRTPTAVAMQVLNYSPVGIVRTIVENIGKGKFDQRLFSQGMGRGITGTAVIYIGMKLFDNNLVTLDYPDNEREQELQKAEGRVPNTIKIGDSWRGILPLGPLGISLLIGAHLKDGLNKTGTVTGALTQSAFGTLKSFNEQTFLKGVNSLMDAVNDPDRYGESYFANFIGSFIPTISSDVARAKDLTERRSRGILERVESRIPFLREHLEPKIDILGREQKLGGNVIETLIDPTRPSKDVSTPLVEEMRRLFDAGFKVSPTLLGTKKGYASLTPVENTELLRRTGQLVDKKLTALVSNQAYKNIPDDQKAKTIENFVDKAKVVAQAEKVLEITGNLSGQELKEKLSELKKSGLLTRDVFVKYQELR